jgi:hypothetical protein
MHPQTLLFVRSDQPRADRLGFSFGGVGGAVRGGRIVQPYVWMDLGFIDDFIDWLEGLVGIEVLGSES